MDLRNYRCSWLLPAWLAAVIPFAALGGGSGLNVVVVANEVSPESVDLANYYMEQRQLPPEQLLRISWSGGNVQWTRTEFEALLLNQLQAFLAADARRSNQIHYVVLSMDIPYRVVDESTRNSITSSLFYGFKNGAGFGNSYAFSEERFAEAPPSTSPGPTLLATMLTADTLDQARHTVDQGVVGDGTLAEQTAWLAKTSDPDRNKRFRAFDNAIFNARLCSPYALSRIESDSVNGMTDMLGYQTGLANFSVSPDAFVPGAIADSFTSFGGQLFESHGQTTLLEFIHAGAAGSYGTVTEPLAAKAKYPDPQVYFYQARGFGLAECYYQGLAQPYQGLVVGEPLAAPFRSEPFSGGWYVNGSNTVLQGITNIYASFTSGDSGTPIESIDLFVDDVYNRTLTACTPTAGNLLSIHIDGYPVDYVVPGDASITGIASDLADLLNQPEHADITGMEAKAFGDRIELQSLRTPFPAGTVQFVDQPDDPAVPRTYQAVHAEPWGRARTRVAGVDDSGRFQFSVDTPAEARYVIEASSNLVSWVPVLTNAAGGPMDFVEMEGASYARRFYRAAPGPGRATPTWMIPLGLDANGAFRAQVNAPAGAGCIVQASPDGMIWTDVHVQEEGGVFEFVDAMSTNEPCLIYRTRAADSNLYADVSIQGTTASSGSVLKIEHDLAGPYLVYASTNAAEWFPVYETISPSGVKIETGSEAGSGDRCTTHLTAASSVFLDSVARGYQRFDVELDWFSPALSPDSYLELEVTLTNSQVITVSATNPPGNTSDIVLLLQELEQAVASHPDLASSDGIEIDDIVDGIFPGSGQCSVIARDPGWQAAGIQVHLKASSDLVVRLYAGAPHTGPVTLEENLADLRPRNHLYVGAGLASLQVAFDLDTTVLEDGHHELRAVAYGGDSVHAQTHSVLQVVVDNTPLEASIGCPYAEIALSVTNEFAVTVQANTDEIDVVRLYGTGGTLGTSTEAPVTVFDVDGYHLGAGTHPFYAVVEAGGATYRTETLHLTLTRD